jgi:very-short-patch-repair endonuclease
MADLTPPRLVAKKPLARSRALRRDSTDSEKRLWSFLQNRKLGGYKFRRQVAIDKFIVDFCCIERRLIVDVDGGQHADDLARYDQARTKQLEARGFRVLRFWNDDVSGDIEGVAEKISSLLAADR